jgi:hypothetical protein
VEIASDAAPKYISYAEVQEHCSRESCWVIIDGQVYDATSVLRWHPAGPDVILRLAGEDATYVPGALVFGILLTLLFSPPLVYLPCVRS